MPMPLETKLIELPQITLPPSAMQQIPISFAQPAKMLEIQHGRFVKLVRIKVGDKSFEGESYVNEVVPPGVPVLVELQNERSEATPTRAGIYVEQEQPAKTLEPPQTPPGPPVVNPPPPGFGAFAASGVESPYVPPPPGQVRQHSLPGQQITVTTPGNGTHGTGAAGPYLPGAPQQPPPYAGTVQSFDVGNQKVTVTSPPQARGAHPHSQVISAVVAPRVNEGPQTVTVGTDEVAILVKRSEAENMLAILRGAVLHPGYCVPLEGAVRRALGEA